MIRVFAPAKINLTLQVGRPRADGRHPLASVVAFADVGDWVSATAADDVSLTLTGPFARSLAQENDNLVLRAAQALRAATGASRGAALKLEKNLPLASGMGGGSSDAAAALKALNALWQLGLAEVALADIARTLGADAPVCVHARAAYMTGAGEIITPIALPVLSAVLVNPLMPIATAAVFREFDRMGLGAGFQAAPAPAWSTLAAVRAGAGALGNDLLAPARALSPALGEVERALRADVRALYVGLSGSGATKYALVQDADAAAALASELANAHTLWWVRACRIGAP